MTPTDPIILSTERLTLRPLVETDALALFQIHADPEVMRYWASPPWTEMEQAHQCIARGQDGFATGSHFQFGIERRADHALVGICSLFSFNLPNRRAEMGYALGRPFWGMGYMNEALHALVDHAFGPLNLHRLEADIDPRNHASAKTLERLGFQKEGYLRERWIVNNEVSDTAFYGLLCREWDENKSNTERQST